MSRLLLMFLLVSCAKVSLVTLKKEELKPYPEFNSITYAKEETTDFEISEVIDAREVKTQVGEALVGVYFDKTPVELYKDTSLFLKDYLYSSLAARNFTVAQNSENKMVVIINKLWVSELIEKYKPERAKCEIDATIKFQNEKKAAQIKLWTSITSKGDMGDATEKLPSTLASCLNELTEKLVKSDALYQFI